MVSYDSARLEWAKARRVELDTLILGLTKNVNEKERDGNPSLLDILELGNHLSDRFQLLEVFADAKERVSIYRRALSSANDTHSIVDISFRLAEALVDCHVRLGETDEDFLEEAIALCRQAAPSLQKDDHYYPIFLCTFGSALQLRFGKSANDEDIFEATALFTTICGDEYASHPRYYRFVSRLGETFRWDHFRTRDSTSLERAEEHHRRALSLCPREATDWCQIMLAYAKTLQELAKPTGGATLALRASDLLLELREFYRALGHLPYRVIGCLCSIRALLADLIDDTQFLHKSMEFAQEGLAVAEDVDKALAHRRVGDSAFDIYRCQGNTVFAAISIQSYEENLKIGNTSASQQAAALTNLGAIYGTRYEYCGRREDLDMSIQLYREILALPLPKTSFELTAVVSGNLSLSLVCRFDLSGDTVDLEESLHYAQKAENAFPPGHVKRPTSLSYLAGALKRRYECMRERADLDRAVTILDECVRLMDTEPHARSNRLLSLSHVLILRYQDQGAEIGDIEKAIMFADKALSLRPLGHPRRHEVLKALSKAHSARFIRQKLTEDYTSAVQHQREAIDVCSSGSTYRAQALFGLARLYLLPEAPIVDVVTATDLCIQALTDSSSVAYLCLQDVLELQPHLELATRQPHFSPQNRRQVLKLYRSILDLLPRVAYFGLDASSRLRVLNKAEHLATVAAAHAILLDEPEIAVEILEQGRGMFWSQALKLRSQFSELPQGLQDQLSTAAYQLERAACQTPLEDDALKGKSELEEMERRIRRLSEEFQALIKQVRTLPGHKRFLLPFDFPTLKTAAERGPVVMFMASDLVCCAIVVQSYKPVQVVRLMAVPSQLRRTMDNLLEESSRGNAGHGGFLTEDGGSENCTLLEGHLRLAISSFLPSNNVMELLLEKLWMTVMQPIVQALDIKPSYGRCRPRIWLCPSGSFALLPLHAAGIQKRYGLGCSSYFVSSYTPTISDLLRARESLMSTPRSEVKVLLAEVPVPFKGSRLLEVAREMEIAKSVIPESSILEMSPGLGRINVPPGGSTIDMVLNTISAASIFHIATHGINNQDNALYSGFAMQDGMLTLSKLMSLNLPKAFLAILSACNTAKSDSSHPDQTLHLAAAMLFVGFRSVIGTMGPMHDKDGPNVSKEIYQQLFGNMHDGIDADDAAYALDHAVEMLRQSGASASRWVPFVHIGM